eukprot:242875-Rhodomonas_salina.1
MAVFMAAGEVHTTRSFGRYAVTAPHATGLRVLHAITAHHAAVPDSWTRQAPLASPRRALPVPRWYCTLRRLYSAAVVCFGAVL